MSEIKFEAVKTNEGFANNGLMKIVRGGNLITLESGKEAGKEELANGIITEGTFIASGPNKFNPDKNDYLVREENGTLTVLAGTATLDRQFASVNVGELVRVMYNGRRTIKRKGGGTASMHDFKVLRAVLEAEAAD
jgi:hypothetical protein